MRLFVSGLLGRLFSPSLYEMNKTKTMRNSVRYLVAWCMACTITGVDFASNSDSH